MICYGIKSQKLDFQTARQSQIDFNMANMSKYGNFNFVVEYPTWVSIKRTSTGKLAVGGQNFIYGVQLKEKVLLIDTHIGYSTTKLKL